MKKRDILILHLKKFRRHPLRTSHFIYSSQHGSSNDAKDFLIIIYNLDFIWWNVPNFYDLPSTKLRININIEDLMEVIERSSH